MARETPLTTGPAAAYVGVTENTLREWVKAGKVRHVKLPSGRLRFYKADLDALLKATEPQAPDAA